MEIFKNKENSMMNPRVLILQLQQLSCGQFCFTYIPPQPSCWLVYPVPGMNNFHIYILKYVSLKKGYFLDYNHNTIILRQLRHFVIQISSQYSNIPDCFLILQLVCLNQDPYTMSPFYW